MRRPALGSASPPGARSCAAPARSFGHKAKKSRRLGAAGRCWSTVSLFSEAIVHTGPYQAEPVAIRRPCNDEVAVGEIDIEVFDLRAPVRGKGHLGARAERPARIGMRFRQAEGRGAQFAEGKTAGAEEHHIVETVTDAAAHRAEPRIGKFPRRKGLFGARRLNVALE